MYYIMSAIFIQYFDIFSKYLVTCFVPGAKGLPGEVDLVCHEGLDPRVLLWNAETESNGRGRLAYP